MAIDDGMLALARDKLYSAVISDTLDSYGFLDQATPPNIRPLDDSLVICGRARTGLYMPISQTAIEIAHLVFIERIFQRQHWQSVVYLIKRLDRLCTNSLCWRILSYQIGKFGFEFPKFLQ